MAPPPPQSSQQGDNSLAALWLTLFFFALLGLIWYLFHAQIVWFVMKIKYFEAILISSFTTDIFPLLIQLKFIKPGLLDVSTLAQFSTAVGQFLRFPFLVLMIVMTAVLLIGHPTQRFRRQHSMQTLLKQEKENWPQITPVTKVDLLKEHVDKGPWSMAMTPMQFAKKHRLIYEERFEDSPLRSQRSKVSIGLLRAEAHQVFALQLGQYWPGIDKLAPHVKALFAVFAARINRDADAAKAIIDRLALSSVSGHLDFTGVAEVLAKYKNAKEVQRAVQSHAFTITVMAAMLQAAREDGVVPSSDFLWLKLVDRPLWFMLNGVGRQTPVTEIAGAHAHWLAENRLGQPINVPMVDEAVKALDIALQEVLYLPDEEEQK